MSDPTPPDAEPTPPPTAPLPSSPAPTAPAPTAPAPTAPAPTMPPPPTGLPTSTDAPVDAAAAKRRRTRTLVLAIGIPVAALVLIGTGIGVFVGVQSAAHAPEKTVQAYLDALVAGHAEAALEQLDPAPAGDTALLTDEVYAATDDVITDYRITGSTSRGPSATVTAEITAGSATWTEDFALTAVGRDLLWNVWAVDGTTLPEVDLDWFAPDVFGVAVNGVALPADVNRRVTLTAFPGTYEFGPAAESELLAAEPVSATVAGFSTGAGARADTSITLTAEGEAQARAALNSFLNGCIKQHVLSPKGGCGFGILPDDQTYTTLNWSITRRPAVTFEAYDGTGFEVVTTKTGVLKLHGENAQYIATGIVDDYEYYGFIDVGHDGKVTFTSGYED